MSKETKFTKGDWELQVYDLPITSSECYYILDDKGNSIADTFIKDDAHLIKTAPKLYNVLDKIVNMQVKNYGNSMMTHIELISLAQEAKATLAEARGEE